MCVLHHYDLSTTVVCIMHIKKQSHTLFIDDLRRITYIVLVTVVSLSNNHNVLRDLLSYQCIGVEVVK